MLSRPWTNFSDICPRDKGFGELEDSFVFFIRLFPILGQIRKTLQAEDTKKGKIRFSEKKS